MTGDLALMKSFIISKNSNKIFSSLCSEMPSFVRLYNWRGKKKSFRITKVGEENAGYITLRTGFSEMAIVKI